MSIKPKSRVSWADFNKQFNMSEEDWAEWFRTKKQYYKNRTYRDCPGCGIGIYDSPLIAFLVAKGKMSPYCPMCEKKYGRKS